MIVRMEVRTIIIITTIQDVSDDANANDDEDDSRLRSWMVVVTMVMMRVILKCYAPGGTAAAWSAVELSRGGRPHFPGTNDSLGALL